MRLVSQLAAAATILVATTGASVADEVVTWTGWFADMKCASARAAAGTFSAPNADCSKICIEKGATPVFISEQAKAIFEVKDYSSVLEELGYHLEVQAVVDKDAKTIAIRKLTRLEYQGSACARPKMSK